MSEPPLPLPSLDDPPLPTYICNTCRKPTQYWHLQSHNPQCYVNFCIQANTVPLCTCASCGGARCHPGDVLINGKLVNILQTSPQPTPTSIPTPPVKKEVVKDTKLSFQPLSFNSNTTTTLTTVNNEVAEKKPEEIILQFNQMTGQRCILCPAVNKTAKAAGLPLIYLGQHRIFLICKKAHLHEKNDQIALLDVLEREFELIKKADTPLQALMQSQEDEEPIQYVYITRTVCYGCVML